MNKMDHGGKKPGGGGVGKSTNKCRPIRGATWAARHRRRPEAARVERQEGRPDPRNRAGKKS